MKEAYFDNATALIRLDERNVVSGEPTSAYGVLHDLAGVYAAEEKKLLSYFPGYSRYYITSCWEDIPRCVIRSCGKKRVGVFLTDVRDTVAACDEARQTLSVQYFREIPQEEDALLFFQCVHPLTGASAPFESLSAARERKCRIALDVSYALGKVSLAGALGHADYLLVRGAAIGSPVSCVIAKECFLERHEAVLCDLTVLGRCLEKAFSDELFFATECLRLKKLFEVDEEVLFQNNTPHISCITFSRVKNELLLFTLARRGVFATIGGGPFPLLERALPLMGESSLRAMSALSFCFGSDIVEEDVVEAKTRLRRAVKELKVISEGMS